MEEKISVIVPIHNAEKYLESSIKSILGQTYRNLEIILVDDCSNDRSAAICDEFVKAEGFSKVECSSDPEAKKYAAEMSYESESYPVVYFNSDTTGEKAYEEFFIPGEKVNMERFSALGVVEETTNRDMNEIKEFFTELEGIFASPEFTKAQVVESIKKFIPNFEHEEKGKNLDQKM